MTGLVEILAVSRLMADTDCLGQRGYVCGWHVWMRDMHEDMGAWAHHTWVCGCTDVDGYLGVHVHVRVGVCVYGCMGAWGV